MVEANRWHAGLGICVDLGSYLIEPPSNPQKQFGVRWIWICWNQGADPFEDGLEELARHQSFTEAFQDMGLDLERFGHVLHQRPPYSLQK